MEYWETDRRSRIQDGKVDNDEDKEDSMKYWETDRRSRLQNGELDSDGDHEKSGVASHTKSIHGSNTLVIEALKRPHKHDCDKYTDVDCDNLTHVDTAGKVKMVDVNYKPDTTRTAVASATIYLGEKVFQLVKENKMKKGDVLTISKLAGIMAAKRTSELIPLCHNIFISGVNVLFEFDEEKHCICITSSAKTSGKTGVEMEAIMAASVAAITIYDMCKAVSKDMVISDVKLEEKTGGVRGNYLRQH